MLFFHIAQYLPKKDIIISSLHLCIIIEKVYWDVITNSISNSAKMAEHISKPISTQSSHSDPQTRKKYAKLTPELKRQFLKQIIFQNKSIKDASQMLKINYSSAKAIVSAHKKSKMIKPKKNWHRKNWKTASYQDIDENNSTKKFTINVSVGGLEIKQHQVFKTKMIYKPIVTLVSKPTDIN